MTDIPSPTSRISEGTKTFILASENHWGGARLSNHWNSDGGLKTKQKISDGGFDFVILQEQSMGTIQSPKEFYQYIKPFAKYCRKKGDELVLYQAWAKEYAPDTQTQISAPYQKAALENSAIIAPVGDA